MSRIDVHMLVKALENRIALLDQNPIPLVPDEIISAMLEQSIQSEIENMFKWEMMREIRKQCRKDFDKQHKKLAGDIIQSLLGDTKFKLELERGIKKSIINNIK